MNGGRRGLEMWDLGGEGGGKREEPVLQTELPA